MNTQRIIVLGLAAVAAAGAAFLARGLLGGGTQTGKAEPAPQVATTEVLVAAGDLQPGTKLMPDQVRWQGWPKSSVDASFITHDANPDVSKVVNTAVVRSPLVTGQPVTDANVVHSDSAGFMAATLTPGMRAVSVGISTESGAGGFILPNDRVDVMSTTLVSDNPRRFRTRTLLNDIRVLAVDQTAKEDKDQKVVLAKTATLELTQKQSEMLEKSQAGGTLSLSLRSLTSADSKTPAAKLKAENASTQPSEISVIRYGVARVDAGQQKE